jgi:hypothetical protein
MEPTERVGRSIAGVGRTLKSDWKVGVFHELKIVFADGCGLSPAA